MSTHVKDSDGLLDRLEEIRTPGGCEDWAARLQELCEEFWALLEHDGHVSQQHVTAFIQVLSNKEGFELARLIIPDLRDDPAVPHENHHKQNIIDRTRPIRAEVTAKQSCVQREFDQPLYQEEKHIFAEAELYRASLLLYNSASLTAEQKAQVKEWVAARPGVTSLGRTIM